MPKLFYALTVAAVLCAAILFFISYRYGQAPRFEQSAATVLATGYYLNLGLLSLASAPILAAIGYALELLEKMADSTESTRFQISEMNRNR